MASENILAKVKKLLALSEGKANIAESAAAAAKAQDLIDRYRISDEALSDAINSQQLVVGVLTKTAQAIWWQITLGKHIGEANSCAVYVLECRDNTLELRVFGSNSDVEISAYFFHYLKREINWLLHLELKKHFPVPVAEIDKFSDAFRTGCVHAIRDRLAVQREMLTAEIGTQALMPLTNQLAKVKKALADGSPQMQSMEQHVTMDESAFNKGLEAGKKIPLNKGLGGSDGPAGITTGTKLLR